VKVKATLVRPNSRQELEFEITKTKGGKFSYATQRNVEQLFEALDSASLVIFTVPMEYDEDVKDVINSVRNGGQIDVVRFLRKRFNSGLRSAVEVMREYFNQTTTRLDIEASLAAFLRDIQNGSIEKKLKSLEYFYYNPNNQGRR
jgi:hypothetical protein